MEQRHRAFWRREWQSKAHRRWFAFCAVALAVYAAYVLYFGRSDFLVDRAATVCALVGFIALSLAFYALEGWLVKRFSLCAPRVDEPSDARRAFWHAWMLGAGLSLCVLGLTLAAAYPGGANYDVANQWHQAHTGQFNNWHPVFHTLLIWLVTRLWDSYPFVILVQIAVFSAAFGWLGAVLRRQGVPLWLIALVQGIVLLSPLLRNHMTLPGKDNAMTIGVVVLTGQALCLLFSGGAWLKRPRNAICFGLALAFTTLVRHNGVLFTLPLILLVIFCYGKAIRRSALLGAAVMLAACVLVRVPLYGMLDVVYPENTAEEAVGIPMTILCNAKTTAPEALDAESAAFLGSLADEETWQSTYIRDRYNSIKFSYPREMIRDAGVGNILQMAVRTAQSDPRSAFETVNHVTGLVWDVSGENRATEGIRRLNTFAPSVGSNALVNGIGEVATTLFEAPMAFLPLTWLTQNLGVQLLLLLAVTLWALYRHGTRTLTLAFPTLCYHLATMLLLCGEDARFFQFALVTTLPAILGMLYAGDEKSAVG